MLRSIIIEDEDKSRSVLRLMLSKYCSNVTVVEECTSVQEAIAAIGIHSPDLIFLDIEMPNESGIDLLNQLKEINFEIIFTTAHSKYAVTAIKLSAIDFLLKPINPEELIVAVAKAEERILEHSDNRRTDTLLFNMKDGNTDKKIALPTSNRLEFINIGDIIRCESDNNYTVFHLQNGDRIMVSKTIAEYEKLLSDYQFIRVHQSNLINLKHVKKYERGNGGWITMSDKSKVEVSRRKKDEFLKRIAKDIIH